MKNNHCCWLQKSDPSKLLFRPCPTPTRIPAKTNRCDTHITHTFRRRLITKNPSKLLIIKITIISSQYNKNSSVLFEQSSNKFAMKEWINISLILCLFGFYREIRPSEPFITEFLSGEWRNITSEQVNREVYPVGTYSYLGLLVVVFLVTDILR